MTELITQNIIIVFVIAFFIIIILVLLCASNYFFNYALLSKPSSFNAASEKISEEPDTSQNTPETYEESCRQSEIWFNRQPAEEIIMTSIDGLKLKGYFLPAPQKSNKLALIAHGYRCRASEMGAFVRYYHNNNFNVFTPDDRAHGDSEGRYISMGWLDRLDYLKWIDLLIKKLGPDIEIVIHGRSMGGATAMMLSGEELPKNVKCIIEDCGYTSVEDEFKYQIKTKFHLPSLPLIPLASLQAKLRIGYSFKEASAVEAVKKCKVPMLFIHGDRDNYVPTEMVYPLYDAAKCEKELWIVPKAAHAEAYFTDKSGYENRLKNFYSKYLGQ